MGYKGNHREFLKKLNLNLSYDPANLLLGNLPKRNGSVSSCKGLYTHIQRHFICNNSKLETTKMFINRGISKLVE